MASEDGLSLPLLVAKNRSGYYGVSHQTSRTKPYRAQLKRGGEDVRFCSFATAEEAAQCVARSPEGQAAAERAAASSSHAVQRPPVLIPPLIRLLLISLRGLGGSMGSRRVVVMFVW